MFDGRSIYHGSMATDAPDLVVSYASGYRASWQTSLGGVPPILVEDNTQPWSGDHFMDPAAVPGVLFADHPIDSPMSSMESIAARVQQELGGAPPTALSPDAAPRGLSAPVFGVLDWPAPVLQRLDQLLALALPDALRLTLYGLLAGIFSIWLYARVSDQVRLRALRSELKSTHRMLATFDGAFADLRKLIGRTMRLSLRQLRLTLGPALLASLPLLLILPWMSNRFDRQYPAPGASVLTCVQSVMAQLDWSVQTQTPADADAGCVTFNWPEADGKVRMTDKAGALAIDLPLAVPAAIVHQPWSWNWLIGNPAGELSTRSAVQAIEMHLPERQFLPFGPAWLRGWLAAFLLSMLVSALVYKHRRGIA